MMKKKRKKRKIVFFPTWNLLGEESLLEAMEGEVDP